MRLLEPHAIGASLERMDGKLKVTGTAPYAFEQRVQQPAYLHPVQSAIARGRIRAIDTGAAERVEGVIAVITPRTAPRLASDDNKELWVLQSDEIHFRGQFIAAVVAESMEAARLAADLVQVDYDVAEHDVRFHAGRNDLYAPKTVNPSYPTDTDVGDAEAAFSAAAVKVDATYSTPMEYNQPMEPHSTIAIWDAARLTLYDSTQSAHSVRTKVAATLGLRPDQVRVVSPYVGGGFGSKGEPHAHNILVALAALRSPGRAVKLALTRQQMFTLAGHRTPTIQRFRLGAGRDGRLTAIIHEVVEQTSRFEEFAEQTALPTRIMYAAPNRRTRHRLAALDVPKPSWMRAPGETPGMFAGEVAMDELAVACGLDPIELRLRNEPERDPESGKDWGSRHLVDCLREGARRFGWTGRDPRARQRSRGSWFFGLGVASATYPRYVLLGSRAAIRLGEDGRYVVRIGAADLGTGTWTTLTQVAADALECPVATVKLEIGDTEQPNATVAGGSSGTSSWGWAIVAAARELRRLHGARPPPGAEASAETPKPAADATFAQHSFGAQFAEVRVNAETGEVRVARMLGVFSAGRIINPRLARSQFIGGMTMGLSMALHEESVMDERLGLVINHDLAGYHIATNADAANLDAVWLEEVDDRSTPMGSRGIGEIGIVGAAAAIANAVYHATGRRVRDLPITPDKLLT
ncbi:MAG TPA: xanthine dehydrogenase family protein molybdopterin-binding subunit [Steroidobacteraceae bacterium]|jgi:xanthine dehydrogenase YagR molybdenum-binding subunit|nr:xanthine dehydrogenase family protein molybdopterin-binding subunit [Steroidobacteraceae bacterium]